MKKLICTMMLGLPAAGAYAQVIPSTTRDVFVDVHNCNYACSTDISAAGAHTLNCDMHDVSSPALGVVKFFAVAFTATDVGKKHAVHPLAPCFIYDPTPAYASGVRIEQVPAVGPVHAILGGRDICLPDQAHPDVVLGNDYYSGNPGDFYVGVVYLNNLGQVEMLNCPVTNVGINSFPYAQKGAQSPGVVISTPGRIVTSKPHIDMFADANCTWWNGKILRKFFATWSEFDPGTGINYVMGRYGDLPSLTISPPVVISPRVPGEPQGIHPDVGCREMITPSPDDVAYVSFIDPTNNDLRVVEVFLNGFGGGGGLSGFNTLPPIDYGTNYVSIDPPRIEAQPYADVLPNEATWQIVTAVDDGSGYKRINGYNNATAPVYTPTVISVDPKEQHFSSSVAGVGPNMAAGGFSGKIGQNRFSIAYYSTFTNNPVSLYPGIPTGSTINGDFYSNYVKIPTGVCSNPNVNYEVNYYTLFQANPHTIPDNAPTAISSSSNTGDDLLTVWYQGFNNPNINWGFIQHKITNSNTYAFKPTPVRDVQQEFKGYGIYPNPAYDKLNVKGAKGSTYKVTDVLGKTLLSGKIHSDDQAINIAELAPGFYLLNTSINDKVRTDKFVKE